MINLPPDQESPIQSPFAQLFRQIDPRFLFQLLQSPLVQRLISQFFTAPHKTASRKSFRLDENRGNAFFGITPVYSVDWFPNRILRLKIE